MNTIWVKTTFEACHRWLEAPDHFFLKSYHRHVFHVTLGMQVGGQNREIEFFSLKESLNKYLQERWEMTSTESSCEMMAQDILDAFDGLWVTVSEDGENGATIYKDLPVLETKVASVLGL